MASNVSVLGEGIAHFYFGVNFVCEDAAIWRLFTQIAFSGIGINRDFVPPITDYVRDSLASETLFAIMKLSLFVIMSLLLIKINAQSYGQGSGSGAQQQQGGARGSSGSQSGQSSGQSSGSSSSGGQSSGQSSSNEMNRPPPPPPPQGNQRREQGMPESSSRASNGSSNSGSGLLGIFGGQSTTKNPSSQN